MMQTRRDMLARGASVAAALAGLWLLPQAAQAAWSQAAFDAKTMGDLMKANPNVENALAFTGLDIVTAFTAVVASVNNTGPGLGLVGPATTYEVLEDFQTWICIFAMLLGRLEIFTLLVVLTPAFWRK